MTAKILGSCLLVMASAAAETTVPFRKLGIAV